MLETVLPPHEENKSLSVETTFPHATAGRSYLKREHLVLLLY